MDFSKVKQFDGPIFAKEPTPEEEQAFYDGLDKVTEEAFNDKERMSEVMRQMVNNVKNSPEVNQKRR